MNRDKDLEIAYRQLQAYAFEPAGKSALMDAVAAAWNRGVQGICVVCGERPATEDTYCAQCFAEVEADQDALVAEAKELQRQLSRDPADHDDHCNEMRHPHIMACNCEGPDPAERQGFEEEA